MHSVNHINDQSSMTGKTQNLYSSTNYHIAEFLWQSARYLNLSEDNLRQIMNSKSIDNIYPENNH